MGTTEDGVGDAENSTSAEKNNEQEESPGDQPVKTTGIMLMMAYLILIFLFTTYVLVKIWPHPAAIAASTQTTPNQQSGSQQQTGVASNPSTTGKPQAQPE